MKLSDPIGRPRRACEICGEPIQDWNRVGVCSRNYACRAETQARHAALKGGKRRPLVHCELCGKSMRGAKYGVCRSNPRCDAERARRMWIMYPERIRERGRKKYRKNIEKRRAYGRLYYWQNKQKALACAARYRRENPEKYKAVLEKLMLKRRLNGSLPAARCVGDKNPAWTGGRECVCVVCGKPVGWRSPSKLARSKSGPHCADHAKIKGSGSVVPCRVRGKDTMSRYGVCRRGTKECENEYQLLHKQGGRRKRTACHVCGRPTIAWGGVCCSCKRSLEKEKWIEFKRERKQSHAQNGCKEV